MINKRRLQELRARRRRRPASAASAAVRKNSWLVVPPCKDPSRSDATLITVGMASIPARERGMYAVLEQILPQCDRFDLSLNGYPADYTMKITSPKLNVFRNDNKVGPHGKLLNAHQTAGYFLTIDDDLIYPSAYVAHMVAGIDKYGRQAYVGYHGNLIAERVVADSKWRRCLFSHQDRLMHDLPVHMLGTGIFGYHSAAGRIDCQELEPGKIDDQVAMWAQARRIPMVALAHPDKWVVEDRSLYLAGTPLRRNVLKSTTASNRIKAARWNLYLPNNWGRYHR